MWRSCPSRVSCCGVVSWRCRRLQALSLGMLARSRMDMLALSRVDVLALSLGLLALSRMGARGDRRDWGGRLRHPVVRQEWRGGNGWADLRCCWACAGSVCRTGLLRSHRL